MTFEFSLSSRPCGEISGFGVEIFELRVVTSSGPMELGCIEMWMCSPQHGLQIRENGKRSTNNGQRKTANC